MSPEERAALQLEADRITAEIRAIDEKFFSERDADRELAAQGRRPRFNPKPVDPVEARARLQRRRDIEKLLEGE